MSQKRAKMECTGSSSGVQDFCSDAGDSGGGLEKKVGHLQESLQAFRAEVELKMTILEQILTTRNEQFVIQKQLLDREHALYESVLAHWKNTAELAANGLTIKFLDDGKDGNVTYEDDVNQGSILGKRRSSAATRARRERRKRLRDPLKSGSDAEDSNGVSGDDDGFPEKDYGEIKEGEEGVVIPVENSDADDAMERHVFIDLYSEERQTSGRFSTKSVWKFYLCEENGKTAMCKICDEKGIQKILKLQDGRTATLLRHLKFTHKIIIDPNAVTGYPTAHSSLDSTNGREDFTLDSHSSFSGTGMPVPKQRDPNRVTDLEDAEEDSMTIEHKMVGWLKLEHEQVLPTKKDIMDLIASGSPKISYDKKKEIQKRSKKADAWSNFNIVKLDGVPVDFVCCTTCSKVFAYTPSHGTSTISAHARTCEPLPA